MMNMLDDLLRTRRINLEKTFIAVLQNHLDTWGNWVRTKLKYTRQQQSQAQKKEKKKNQNQKPIFDS